MTTDSGPGPRSSHDADPVCIALALDDRYAEHTAATLQSVIDHAAPDRLYEVHALAADLSRDTIGKFERQVAAYPNVSLGFHIPPDVSRYRQRSNKAGIGYPDPAFYRLELPTLLPSRDKVLYLDSDTIARTDVASLFDTDIAAHVGAAARDAFLTSPIHIKTHIPRQMGSVYGQTWEDYIVDFLGIPRDKAGGYVNTGIFLMNLKAWSQEGITEKIIEKAHILPHQAIYCDQDLINSVLYDRILRIDGLWNVLADFAQDLYGLDDVAAPYIIHYAGNKPWAYGDLDGRPYWEALLRTPFAVDAVMAAMRRQLPAAHRPALRLPFLPRMRRSLAKRLLRLARLAGGPQAGLNR